MSYGQVCQEHGCKNQATKSISVMIRSRFHIKPEISAPISYTCDEHQHQDMNEFIPPALWDKVVLQFINQGKVPPIKMMCYLVVKDYKQYIPGKHLTVVK